MMTSNYHNRMHEALMNYLNAQTMTVPPAIRRLPTSKC
jgi:hypothetical protein